MDNEPTQTVEDKLYKLKRDRDLFEHERNRAQSMCVEMVGAIQTAINELGVPQPEYPAPITNAYDVLKKALLNYQKMEGGR